MTGTPAPGPELIGRAASPGLAAGSVVVVDVLAGDVAASGDAHAEAANLQRALETASAQIAGLMETVEPEAAEMLEFQLAMLEDEELTAPVRAAIADGSSAAAAFAEGLDAVIADYRASQDEYFRARTADLADIRERVLRALSGKTSEAPVAGAVLVGKDLTPTRFLETDWSAGGGIALADGSPSSHVAMLARARGVPMVTGLGAFDTSDLKEALVDGDSGRVRFNPDETARRQHAERAEALAREAEAAKTYLGRPAATACGVPISVMINVAAPEEVDALDPAHCDGIGLMRTEFLFHGAGCLPDEDSQYLAYRKVLEWAGGRSVTIRTLDAGGDKPVPGLTVEESNPFLGCRGIRLSLRRPEVFRVQLRALARAGCHGNLQVMLPMVSVPQEIEAAARLLDTCVAELHAEGHEAVRPPLGIMVEVPAVAVTPERFAAAAFFSIGSNDLTQYVLAAGRDSPDVAELGRADDPAVLALVVSTLRGGAAAGLPVSLCGDAGSDLAVLPKLLACGLRRVSVAPAALARVKVALAGMRLGDDG